VITTDARRRGLRDALVDIAVLTVTTIVLLVIVLRLWQADLRLPFVYDELNRPPLTYAPDAPYYVMVVKGLLQHGSYLVNSSLGAPFGQDLADYPETTESLQFLALRVLGVLFGGDAVLTINVYFLLTFVGVALASWFVLRRLGVSRPVAIVVSLLYSFLPYHFARGTANLLLSGYFMVPIAVLLMLCVLSDDPPFTKGTRTDWRVSLRGAESIAILLACAGLASTGPYYALFTVVLLTLAVALYALNRRDWRIVVSGSIVVGTTLLVFAVNLAPSLVYWIDHGRNEVVGRRGTAETEVNGLKVSQLFLPVDDHRIGPLADVQDDSVRFTLVPSERGQQLGVVGALGLVGLIVFTLSALVRRVRAEPDGERSPPSQLGSRADVMRRLGVLTLFAILCGTVSGLSILFSGVGLSQIRSWNRLSIFIGFFALITVAFALDWALPRLPRWRGHAVLAAVVLGAVLVVGIFDQTTEANVPDYDRIERDWESDEAFMRSISRELGDGAMVFQLPYVYFPEAGFFCGTGPYDHARGYVHADDLRWSFGGMRGRETEWQEQVVRRQPVETLDAISAVGFTGVLVDRAGYRDQARELEAAYIDVLDEQPRVSANGRLSFFDLREHARSLRDRLGPAEVRALREQTLAARPEGTVPRPCPDVTGAPTAAG
jgi:phosphoglycerol transferase